MIYQHDKVFLEMFSEVTCMLVGINKMNNTYTSMHCETQISA